MAIPLVPARVLVRPEKGRDRERIQAALDLVSTLPTDADGFRGAVLLAPGAYQLDGTLRLRASGVVLRGSGAGESGTVLIGAPESRDTLIEIEGHCEHVEAEQARRQIVEYAPVGSRRLKLDSAEGLTPGMRVRVNRPCTTEWISMLGMASFSGWRPQDRISWAPRSRDLFWEREVVAVEDTTLVLDAPITTALDPVLGGGSVAPCSFPGRISRVGVENLRCLAAPQRPPERDEEHAWVAVSLDKVENAWVRQVDALYFAGNAILVLSGARSVTIEDCAAREPVSELAGYRRRSFAIGGELVLVQRCRSEQGLRDFTTLFTASGPNVFLQCRAEGALGYSGPDESWASGVLYDSVVIRGNALRFLNLGPNAQGAGWTAANSVLWNCEATEIQVQSPPEAGNQAYGCKGMVAADSLHYDASRMPFRPFVRGGAVSPGSLYLAQLAERKGLDQASALVRTDIAISPQGVALLSDDQVPQSQPRKLRLLELKDGRFTIAGEPAYKEAVNWSWFRGHMAHPLAPAYGPAITRFGAGRMGPGLTDRLEAVVEAIPPGAAFLHHYGLWYDRRRINHNFYGSPELTAEDVTPPHMEQPWARSGQGTDWNGLSKYDLTRFNPWYFKRVKAFADLCDEKGRILHHYFYFQHAIQESRSHYVDFPWRPVNCLQDTGLPDENPAGRTFYDLSSPVRRELHRLYIRHCLEVLKDNRNVIYSLDPEYSGPLDFVQFWLDTLADWQKETGRKVFVSLEVPKAQLDVLLKDPVRRPLLSAIRFHYWFYRNDGTLFAVEGGLNTAPREQLNAAGPLNRAGDAGWRYRAYREYRDAHPDLVILGQTGEK